MIRSFKYAIYPSRSQLLVLESWLEISRQLRNASIQERRDAYKKQGVSIGLYDQTYQLKSLRKEMPEVEAVPFTSLWAVLDQTNKSFQNFFRRIKNKEKAGYPRFKSKSQFNSIPFARITKSPIVAGGKRITVPKLGKIKAKIHRLLEGRPRTMTLKRDCTRRWFCTIACDQVLVKPLLRTGKNIGIDLGLLNFVTDDEGNAVAAPKYYRLAERKLKRLQRTVSRRKRGSNRRKKAICFLAKAHAKVANLRREFAITLAKKLVAQYDVLFVEKLNISGMVRNRHLAKSIQDASWGTFLHWLRVKAESAGREVVEVDPRGTSQECSSCGKVVRKLLATRVHSCPYCGIVLDRDMNAALNIKKRGRRLQGEALDVVRPRRSAKCTEQALGLQST